MFTLRKTSNVLILGVLATTALSCGKKKDKGSGESIGAPQAYPPTALVTPKTLVTSSGTSASLTFDHISHINFGAESASLEMLTPSEPGTDAEKLQLMQTVKDRLFSAGPTNMLQLIKNVDERMKGYDQRVASMSDVPSCLSSTPVDLSTTFSVPSASGSTNFPLFGQCQETLSQSMTIMFGKKDNDWYLVDGISKGTDGSPQCIMTMAKIGGASDADRTVDGYMILASDGKTDNWPGSTALMHFKANVASGTLEFTAGGVGIGAAQVHAKSNSSFVYVQLQADNNVSTRSLYHACYNASDLSTTTLSSCSDLQGSLELVSLGTMAKGSTPVGGAVLNSEANNVDLTQLVPNYCGKLSTAFSGIPAFGG